MEDISLAVQEEKHQVSKTESKFQQPLHSLSAETAKPSSPSNTMDVYNTAH